MNTSSTQVPFMLAAFIAVVIHSITADPSIDGKVKAETKVQATTTKVATMTFKPAQEIKKISANEQM